MLSQWSYVLFLFVIGVKMDIGMINRSGRKALFTVLYAYWCLY
jgi:Kef-type K+ transport system membrane component KefB